MNRKYYWTMVTVLLLTMEGKAFAYLEPGTGSMIFQIVIGAVAGAFFAIKLYWYKLKSFITRSFISRKDTANETERES